MNAPKFHPQIPGETPVDDVNISFQTCSRWLLALLCYELWFHPGNEHEGGICKSCGMERRVPCSILLTAQAGSISEPGFPGTAHSFPSGAVFHHHSAFCRNKATHARVWSCAWQNRDLKLGKKVPESMHLTTTTDHLQFLPVLMLQESKFLVKLSRPWIGKLAKTSFHNRDLLIFWWGESVDPYSKNADGQSPLTRPLGTQASMKHLVMSLGSPRKVKQRINLLAYLRNHG